MLEKEEIISKLSELRVPYDSRKTRLELYRQLEDVVDTQRRIEEELVAGKVFEEEEIPDHEIIDARNSRKPKRSKEKRKWDTVPLEVEEAAKGSPCFGTLYYDGEFVCPRVADGSCEVTQWCMQVQEEDMALSNVRALKEASIVVPEIVPKNNRVQRSKDRHSNVRKETGKSALLASALRMEFLKSERKVSIRQNIQYDVYMKDGSILFYARVTAKYSVTLMMNKRASYVFDEAVHDQENAVKWLQDLHGLAKESRKQLKPATHSVKVVPYGLPSAQAIFVMDLLKQEYEF